MSNLQDIVNICVIVILVVGFFIGTFGNSMILLCTIRNPDLRGKPGILLAVTAFAHIICLSSELIHAYTILIDTGIERILCFKLLFIYLNAIQFQAAMSLIMVLDLLLAIVFPIWYKSCQTKLYLIIMLTPPSLYALSFQYPSIITLTDDTIPRCNTMLVIADPHLATIRFNCNLIVNVLTIVSYILSLIFFYKACINRDQIRPVLKRVGVTAVFFVCTWFLASGGANIISRFNVSSSVRNAMHSSLVIFGVMTYSQNFYILLWRARRYRQTAFEMIFVFKKFQKTRTVSIRPFTSHTNSNFTTRT